MPDNGVKIAIIIDELLRDYIPVIITIEKDAKKNDSSHRLPNA